MCAHGHAADVCCAQPTASSLLGRLPNGSLTVPCSSLANLTAYMVGSSIFVRSIGSPVAAVVTKDLPVGLGPKSYGAASRGMSMARILSAAGTCAIWCSCSPQ
jgi:hypothetical protein